LPVFKRVPLWPARQWRGRTKRGVLSEERKKGNSPRPLLSKRRPVQKRKSKKKVERKKGRGEKPAQLPCPVFDGEKRRKSAGEVRAPSFEGRNGGEEKEMKKKEGTDGSFSQKERKKRRREERTASGLVVVDGPDTIAAEGGEKKKIGGGGGGGERPPENISA